MSSDERRMKEEGWRASTGDSWRFPHKFPRVRCWRPFVQKSCRGFNTDFPVEKRWKEGIHQQIADGDQDHPLVVGHPAVHDFERLVGLGGRTTTFHGFVESKTTYPPAVAHVTEIFEGCYRLCIQCQRAGVRSDNEATRGLRVQGQGRQSEGLVIVGGILLFWRARSLRNSPRDSTGCDKSALAIHRRLQAVFEQCIRKMF